MAAVHTPKKKITYATNTHFKITDCLHTHTHRHCLFFQQPDNKDGDFCLGKKLSVWLLTGGFNRQGGGRGHEEEGERGGRRTSAQGGANEKEAGGRKQGGK